MICPNTEDGATTGARLNIICVKNVPKIWQNKHVFFEKLLKCKSDIHSCLSQSLRRMSNRT
jgi:hypothetical protein